MRHRRVPESPRGSSVSSVEALRNIADTTVANIDEFAEKGTGTNEICYRCKN